MLPPLPTSLSGLPLLEVISVAPTAQFPVIPQLPEVSGRGTQCSWFRPRPTLPGVLLALHALASPTALHSPPFCPTHIFLHRLPGPAPRARGRRGRGGGGGGGKSPRLPAISERASDRAASPKTAQHLASGTGDEPLFLSSHSVTSPSRRNWEKRPGAKSVRTTVTPPAPRQLPGDQARARPRHVLTSAPDSGWGAGGRQTCPLAARGSPPRLYKQHLER